MTRPSKLPSTLILVFTLLISCLPAESAQRNVEDAARILRESIAAPRTVSYIGQVQTVRFASNGATATLVRIEHKAPALTRRWYLAPEALYGNYIITRGITTYRFDTKRARLVVSRNPVLEDETTTAGRLTLMLHNYRCVFDGTETVAERPVRSIVLINKYTGERAMRFWIDENTHLVLRKEEFHSNGAVASQTRFEAIRYTKNIPDDIFVIDAPAGFQRTQGYSSAAPSPDLDTVGKEVGFKPYGPKDLPQGFLLRNARVAETAGIKTVHLSYSDGLRTISLFENDKGAAADFGDLRPHVITFEGHEGRYIEDGPTTLLTWSEHALRFALVGDLGRGELVQIARSVVP